MKEPCSYCTTMLIECSKAGRINKLTAERNHYRDILCDVRYAQKEKELEALELIALFTTTQTVYPSLRKRGESFLEEHGLKWPEEEK